MNAAAWRTVFRWLCPTADTLMALTVSAAGLLAVTGLVQPLPLCNLVAASALAWLCTVDPRCTTGRARVVLLGLTIAVVAASALEAGLAAAVWTGLGWLVCLVRRHRALGAVHDEVVQTSRFVWDLSLLAAAWLWVLAVHTSAGPFAHSSLLLLLFSLLAVVTRLAAMYAAQMLTAGDGLSSSHRTIAGLFVTLFLIIFSALIAVVLFPGVREVTLFALGATVVVIALALAWRAFAASLAGAFAAVVTAYLLIRLSTGVVHPRLPETRTVPGKQPGVGHLGPAVWWLHVPWGWVGIVFAVAALAWLILWAKVPQKGADREPEGVQIERIRLPRQKPSDSAPPTALRRLVARWLTLSAQDAVPIEPGQTLRQYAAKRAQSRRPFAQETSRLANQGVNPQQTRQALDALVRAYENERYGLRPASDEQVQRLRDALRQHGWWRS